MVEGHRQGQAFPFLVDVLAAQPEDLMVLPEAAAAQPEDLVVLPEAAEVPEKVVLAAVVSPQLRDTAQKVVMHPHQTILRLPEEY